MAQQNEIITIILALGVLAFSMTNLGGLRNAARSRLLLGAFAAACGAWVFTVIEHSIWPDFCNIAEHFCYALGSILLATWVLRLKNGHRTAGA